MEIKNKLCSNTLRKVGMLLVHAAHIGMDVSGYGYADENQNSGNVYIWLENYPFTLYIGLADDTIYASWTNLDDGEEVEINAIDMALNELIEWCNELDADRKD